MKSRKGSDALKLLLNSSTVKDGDNSDNHQTTVKRLMIIFCR
ncbi:hypothetical protein [Listeria riparia]|nr:hypothetical protein [Listeria riparia]